jgi:hypothetical protein
MNEMEMMQLSRLLNGMVSEPPRHVTVGAVRRKLLMRRLIAGVTATAAAAFAVSAGLVISAHALGTHPATSARPRSAEPRYYFDEGVSLGGGVVRSTSTGAVTAQLRCPGQESVLDGVATADRETFFMACLQIATGGKPTGTRLYRFTLTRSGRITGFRPVPGGNLKGLRGAYLAASPDGTELAVGVTPARPGPDYAGTPFNIFVINTRTGKHAFWYATRLAGGIKFFFWDLSFARNGQELAAFGWAGCPETPTPRTCKTPGEMIAVNHPAAGGRLATGRVLFTRSSLTHDRHAWIGDAFINPDGTTATAVTSTRTASTIMRVSTATGKPSGVLYRGPSNLAIRPDPSGQFVLVTLQTLNRNLFGWINHGKLAPLKPAGKVVEFDAW